MIKKMFLTLIIFALLLCGCTNSNETKATTEQTINTLNNISESYWVSTLNDKEYIIKTEYNDESLKLLFYDYKTNSVIENSDDQIINTFNNLSIPLDQIKDNDSVLDLGSLKIDYSNYEENNSLSFLMNDNTLISNKENSVEEIAKTHASEEAITLEKYNEEELMTLLNEKYLGCRLTDLAPLHNTNVPADYYAFKFVKQDNGINGFSYDFVNKKVDNDRKEYFSNVYYPMSSSEKHYSDHSFNYQYKELDSSTNTYIIGMMYIENESTFDDLKLDYFSIYPMGAISASFKCRVFDNENDLINVGTMGSVTINVDSINIRQYPYKTSDKIGSAKLGETYVVYGYEKHTSEVEGNPYTWYQIGYNMWVADDGTWLTFTPNEKEN